ncbi:hypothetical protein MtrunA17_Chr1g0171681 [Medicago truncatula]|uniref:Uncharacterized protein n=1 Tax=Medicago truncatula TaxID=3880 RepID=A0A396JL43_MEDTR|nr:uncharacterized protein LOC25483279 [Medicago truncatula]RHN78969.1 hypothetical protein MtrunA17_Chr1g0171681 [Medicago truncatula]
MQCHKKFVICFHCSCSKILDRVVFVEYALRDDSDRVENDGGSPKEEGVLLDLPVQVIAGDQVHTMVFHVVLCMIGMVDGTGEGVVIIAGTGVLNMADSLVVRRSIAKKMSGLKVSSGASVAHYYYFLDIRIVCGTLLFT